MSNKEIKVLYVSLPYTGHEETFPTRCEAAKKKYHKEGCRVITPADIIKDSATPYSQCIGKCIEVLLECDEVVLRATPVQANPTYVFTDIMLTEDPQDLITGMRGGRQKFNVTYDNSGGANEYQDRDIGLYETVVTYTLMTR